MENIKTNMFLIFSNGVNRKIIPIYIVEYKQKKQS